MWNKSCNEAPPQTAECRFVKGPHHSFTLGRSSSELPVYATKTRKHGTQNQIVSLELIEPFELVEPFEPAEPVEPFDLLSRTKFLEQIGGA